jgi:hypothetical protein
MSRNPKPKSARGCQAGVCGYWSVCERYGASAELSLLLQQERPVRMGAAGIASPKRAVSLSRDGASVSLLAKGELSLLRLVPSREWSQLRCMGLLKPSLLWLLLVLASTPSLKIRLSFVCSLFCFSSIIIYPMCVVICFWSRWWWGFWRLF